MLSVNEVKGEMGEEGWSQWKRWGAWVYWRAGGVGLDMAGWWWWQKSQTWAGRAEVVREGSRRDGRRQAGR